MRLTKQEEELFETILRYLKKNHYTDTETSKTVLTDKLFLSIVVVKWTEVLWQNRLMQNRQIYQQYFVSVYLKHISILESSNRTICQKDRIFKTKI